MSLPIIYLTGGMLGDFIYSLSVVKENFVKTGRKGIVCISEKGDHFRYGLINTYKDTYNVIINQDYIDKYEIYNEQPIDIDLTLWRWNAAADYKNWHIKFSNTYNIDWGKNKWLTVESQQKWFNKVLINTTNYRWPYSIDFQLLNNLYPGDLIFISFNEDEYHFFKEKTNLGIPFIKITDFTELCIAIHSCKLMVGSQSTPSNIAFSMHKNCVIGKCKEDYHSVHGHHYIDGLDKIFSHVKFAL
jgi:hypothetical protein